MMQQTNMIFNVVSNNNATIILEKSYRIIYLGRLLLKSVSATQDFQLAKY